MMMTVQQLADLVGGSVVGDATPHITSGATLESAEPGQVTSALPDYLFTTEGQAAWIRDFLRWCETDPSVAGSFYFYPDYAWHPDGPAIGAQGLFLLEDGRPTPAPALLEVRRAAEVGGE